jgi:hypothetical protein
MGEHAEAPPRLFEDHWKDIVVWIGGSSPEELAAVVRRAIVERGLRTFGDVSVAVATDLFARDNARAGWLGDVGFFRGWYLLIACRLLESLRDTAIELRPPDGRRAVDRAS